MSRRLSPALLTYEHDPVITDESDLDATPALGVMSRCGPVAGPVLWPRVAGLVAVDMTQVPGLLGPDRLTAASALDLAAGDVPSPAVP